MTMFKSGKAANLARLRENGFSVPPFFVVPANDVAAAAAHGPEGFERLAERLRQERQEFFLSHPLVAVRSSASDEDRFRSSMAGLYRSKLNVSVDMLGPTFSWCLEAQDSPALISYRQRRHRERPNGSSRTVEQSEESVQLDLIVQAMVTDLAHAAILFTANPDGLLNERVLVVGEGHGDKLVSDQIPSISYYRHATEDKGYLQNPGRLDLLPSEVLRAIWTLADRLEAVFGPALDLELAIDKDQRIWLLQMRPLSNMDAEAVTKPRTILDNSNIVESYPGLTLPLSTDFYHRAYEAVFSGLIRRLHPGPKAKQAEQLARITGSMVYSWNGRAYYQLQNWLKLLRQLPFSDRLIPIWREMMGVQEITPPDQKSLISRTAKLGMVRRLLISFKRVERHYQTLTEDVATIETEFRRLESEAFVPELYETFFTRLGDTVLKHWDITLINDLQAMIASKRLQKQAAGQGMTDPNELLAGISALASMKPVLSIQAIHKKLNDDELDLTRRAARDESLARSILAGRHPALQDQRAKSLTEAMCEHIRLYGDRGIEELKLESKTQRSDARLFFAALSAAESMNLPETSSAQPERPRRQALAAIMRREESRLLRTRVYGMARQVFSRLGITLCEQDRLDDKADVFYLLIDEVFRAFRDETDLRLIVHERKLAYAAYQNLPAYSRLCFLDQPFSKQTAQYKALAETNTLQNKWWGTPCSAGIVRAEVTVIDDAAGATDIKGRILVTKNTDPGWVYLLIQAAGVIAERGSILSHTAIISRELGLPSIVGVDGISTALKTGDLIEMDGSSGKLQMLRRAKT
ncbi:MAG: PEP/pyruvate-binding domain-containing protein [Fastidiosipilaceae bacterium]|jgi:phosphohistidine swiveling domain-containing protein